MKKKLIGGLFSVLYTALMIFSLFVPNNIVPALVTALTSDSLPAELGSGATMPRLDGMRAALIGGRQSRR